MAESQNIEWKHSWKDEYLKSVCGFANAKGGKILIGKNDDGSIASLEDSKRLLEEIPNKIKSLIGLTIDLNLQQTTDGDYLEIDVLPQSVPVSLRGRLKSSFRADEGSFEIQNLASDLRHTRRVF